MKIILVTFTIIIVFISCNSDSNSQSAIKLPPGFKIEVYGSNVPNARSMVLSPSGVLFVGTR